MREPQQDVSSQFALPPRATLTPAEGQRRPPLRFPALRIIAVLCWIVGVVCAAGGVLSAAAIALASDNEDPWIRIVGVAVTVAVGLLSAVFAIALAEIVHVLLATEENTRDTAALLRSRQ